MALGDFFYLNTCTQSIFGVFSFNWFQSTEEIGSCRTRCHV